MAELSYQDLIEAFEAETDLYTELIGSVEERVCARLEEEGIYAHVSGRVKESESFAVKALLGSRYSDPLRQIGDKAGLRIVVPYLRQIDHVEEIVRQEVTVIRREQKLDALAYDQVGYLGVHLDCRLNDAELAERKEFNDCRFEVQLRTNAQGAWAEVAHEQLYKPPAEVPAELKRRIYRLVSLVELFDNEVEAFLTEAAATPGYREAFALEPLALIMLKRFGVRRRPDRQLSLVMAAALVPLYEADADQVAEKVKEWVEANAEKLQALVDGGAAGTCAPIMLQPEILLLLERLEQDPDSVLEAWPEEVPKAWLEEAAVAWEVRLPDQEGQVNGARGD